MKKRFVAVICAAALAVGLLAGCGKKPTGGRETLTVGFDAEFPPYGYMDGDGNYTGFDLELAKEVCKRKIGRAHV